MNSLLDNAIASLQLGIEDYQSTDPKRTLSSIRNYYAGLLLLAKAVILHKAPRETQDAVIAAKYKPILNKDGEVEYKPDGFKTIDFDTIGKRFQDFKIPVKTDKLKKLNALRNEIEHKYTSEPSEALKEVISATFIFLIDLFQQLDKDPKDELGNETFQIILEVKEVFERELEECRNSFSDVAWGKYPFSELNFFCPACESALVFQMNATANTDFQTIEIHCRACEEVTEAEPFVEKMLEKKYEIEQFLSVKDGGDHILTLCPDCGLETYINSVDFAGCAWCEYELGECGRCGAGLTPENAACDNQNFCDYCYHMMSKDD